MLLENSITPIQQYAYTTGKNATDSALIIDAMDILHKGGRGRILHRVERQRLHAPGRPYPRIGPGGAGVRREEDAEAVHQVLRQIHLRRNPRADAAGEGGPCEEKGGREKIRRGRSACGAGRRNCRGKKKPSPDAGHASTIIRPFDDEFRTLLEKTIDDAADDSGWALGDVGSVLSKKMPDFDPRNYGYKNFRSWSGRFPMPST